MMSFATRWPPTPEWEKYERGGLHLSDELADADTRRMQEIEAKRDAYTAGRDQTIINIALDTKAASEVWITTDRVGQYPGT